MSSSAPKASNRSSTVACRYWTSTGKCFFGDQCNFAHSLTEKGSAVTQAVKEKGSKLSPGPSKRDLRQNKSGNGPGREHSTKQRNLETAFLAKAVPVTSSAIASLSASLPSSGVSTVGNTSSSLRWTPSAALIRSASASSHTTFKTEATAASSSSPSLISDSAQLSPTLGQTKSTISVSTDSWSSQIQRSQTALPVSAPEFVPSSLTTELKETTGAQESTNKGKSIVLAAVNAPPFVPKWQPSAPAVSLSSAVAQSNLSPATGPHSSSISPTSPSTSFSSSNSSGLKSPQKLVVPVPIPLKSPISPTPVSKTSSTVQRPLSKSEAFSSIAQLSSLNESLNHSHEEFFQRPRSTSPMKPPGRIHSSASEASLGLSLPDWDDPQLGFVSVAVNAETSRPAAMPVPQSPQSAAAKRRLTHDKFQNSFFRPTPKVEVKNSGSSTGNRQQKNLSPKAVALSSSGSLADVAEGEKGSSLLAGKAMGGRKQPYSQQQHIGKLVQEQNEAPKNGGTKNLASLSARTASSMPALTGSAKPSLNPGAVPWDSSAALATVLVAAPVGSSGTEERFSPQKAGENSLNGGDKVGIDRRSASILGLSHSMSTFPVEPQRRFVPPQRQSTPPLQQPQPLRTLFHPSPRSGPSTSRTNQNPPYTAPQAAHPAPMGIGAANHRGATFFFPQGQPQFSGIGRQPSNQPAFGAPNGGFNPVGKYASAALGRSKGFFPPGKVPLAMQFMDEGLRGELQKRSALVYAQVNTQQDLPDFPETVNGRFHTLFPLEDLNSPEEVPSPVFGVRSLVIKGISSIDGCAYALRRIDGRQVIPTAEMGAAGREAVDRWSILAGHPNISVLRDSFISSDMEDSAALWFAHDYYPGLTTLQALHLTNRIASSRIVNLTVTEEQLWSYLTQLVSALRAVHSAGLFCRPGGLHPSKILVSNRGRVRVSSLGILDVLNGDPADDPRLLQREDLGGLGRLILLLACGPMPSLDFMAGHFSPELVRITQSLLATVADPVADFGPGIRRTSSAGRAGAGGGGGGSPGLPGVGAGGFMNIRQLSSILADRIFGEMDQIRVQNDGLMEELARECENGRLFRLLVKIGMVNERPDDDVDPAWAETGDRYLLKLFRHFLFHQTSEAGTPLLDWGHIIEALNKLDVGVQERIVLMSPDERSMIIVSYDDLKRCIDKSYSDLSARASGEVKRIVYSS